MKGRRYATIEEIKTESKMFYKTSLDDNSEFKILDLSPKIGRPRIYENIDLPPLYSTIRPITMEKYKDIMDLLPYIPPIFHKHFTSLNMY